MKIKKLIELADALKYKEWINSYGDSIRTVVDGNSLRICTMDGCHFGDNGEDQHEGYDEYIAAACPANLLPILRAAEKLAEALKFYEQFECRHRVTQGLAGFQHTTTQESVFNPATEALAEWKKVNE